MTERSPLDNANIEHRSRVCHIVIDVNDLTEGVRFWSGALGAKMQPIPEASTSIYRKLTLPNENIRVLLQLVPERKESKTRVHMDIETDNVEAEVKRLEELGARRSRLVDERGFRFWVMEDPFENEFCVLQPEFPDLLAQQTPWAK